MTTAQVVEMSVTTTNSLSKDYLHSDDHTGQTTDTPGFKPFTNNLSKYTTLSQMITLDKQLILLGSNHLPTVFLKTTLTWMITQDKQLILLDSNRLL